MMTRKELLGSLMSKGVVVTNPLFENEDLGRIHEEVENILNMIDADEMRIQEVPIAEQKLIGKEGDQTAVVHIIYPAEELYGEIMPWAARIKEEYEGVDLKYFEELDAFVFFAGNEDEAESIAEELINKIE